MNYSFWNQIIKQKNLGSNIKIFREKYLKKHFKKSLSKTYILNEWNSTKINEIQKWFYNYPVKRKEKYIYFEEIQFINFNEDGFFHEKMSHYKFLNIYVKNIEHKCFYKFSLKNSQLALMVIDSKITAAACDFGTKPFSLKINYSRIRKKYLKSFEVVVEYDNCFHKYIMAFPNVDNMGYHIVKIVSPPNQNNK